jgi:hypothetical protein
MFQDNSSKRSADLDYIGMHIGNKQDSIKLSKDRQSSIHFISLNNDHDDQASLPDLIFDFGEDENNEEEMLGHNTKPCLTNKDYQSVADLNVEDDPELPSIPILKIDTEENLEKIDTKNIILPVRSQPIEEEKYPNSTKIKEDTIIFEPENNYREDNLSENSVEIWHKTRLLKYGKTQMEKKGKLTDSFEWNNFLVRRACFRGISVYYKNKFSKINTNWQRKRVNKKKKTPMHDLIKEFAQSEFGDIVDKITDQQWIEFRNTLYGILFSHRYKKDDEFLEGVNFDQIRGVLYSYTTEMRVALVSNPFFSLVILNYMEKGRQSFVAQKTRGKPQSYSDELKAELDSLKDESESIIKPYKFYE